jgi:hypothetical protein
MRMEGNIVELDNANAEELVALRYVELPVKKSPLIKPKAKPKNRAMKTSKA